MKPKTKRKNKISKKKLSILKPKKHQKIYSSKNKHLEYLSDETKAKKIEEQLQKIQELPDFEKIHDMLNGKTNTNKRLYKISKENKRYQHWSTFFYLIKEINQCILENNWNNLTKFLLSFITAPGYHQPFMLKSALINFTMNPASVNNGLLKKFLTECLACQNQEEIIKLLEKQFCIDPNEKITISHEDNNTKLSKSYKLRKRKY